MNPESVFSRLFQSLHHRSLTVSAVAVFLAFLASGFLVESKWEQAPEWLLSAYIVAILSFATCCVGFLNLLKDDKSGYGGFHLSVATLLWALACLPISLLFLIVMRQVIGAYFE